jgi:lysophospholipid acyltransferase (LPLAT)-like uncharacterized protein
MDDGPPELSLYFTLCGSLIMMYSMSVFERIYWLLIGFLGRSVVWFLGVTARKNVIGEKAYIKLRKAGKPVIFVLWHSRILFASYFFRNRNITALVSPSRDGEIIAQILLKWGFHLLRGSSSHSVVQEWRNMKRLMQEGGELIIVGDGPKGPAQIMKPGAVKLAQATGAYVVPFTYSAKKTRQLETWDRFLLFYPFTKLTAVYGKPIKVKSDLKPHELEKKRLRIQHDLIELEKMADGPF